MMHVVRCYDTCYVMLLLFLLKTEDVSERYQMAGCANYKYIYVYIVFLLIVQLIPVHNIAAFINICRFFNQCC